MDEHQQEMERLLQAWNQAVARSSELDRQAAEAHFAEQVARMDYSEEERKQVAEEAKAWLQRLYATGT